MDKNTNINSRYIQIGGRIRQARLHLGMSQEELGRLYGCSDARISRIESGRLRLGIADLERFASILRQKFAWLLQDESVSISPGPPRSALLDLEMSVNAYLPVYDTAPVGPKIHPIDYIALSRINMPPASYTAYRIPRLNFKDVIIEGDTIIVDSAAGPRHGVLGLASFWQGAGIYRYVTPPPGPDEPPWYFEGTGGPRRPPQFDWHGAVVAYFRRL